MGCAVTMSLLNTHTQVNRLSNNPAMILLFGKEQNHAIYYSCMYGLERYTPILEQSLSTGKKGMRFGGTHRSSAILIFCHFFKKFEEILWLYQSGNVYMDGHIFLNV